jgi:hypothetical protein
MLHDPARHEPLLALEWNEALAREAIAHVVADTDARFSPETFWPMHPRDADGGDTAPAYPLYHGACGVIWALTYLEATGAATLARSYAPFITSLRERNAAWLATFGDNEASYLMGDVGWLLLEYGMQPSDAVRDRLAALIEGNVDHPARELMWGSPGTMLAALFLHERTGDARWADLFRTTAHRLRSQLLWSDQFGCEYWTQDLYGRQSTYLDAVHGFVATAVPLIRGRHLLGADAWDGWSATIANTIRATATWDHDLVNWRAWLTTGKQAPMLMQFCHGAPGFVICLAGMPGPELDDLLLSAGEATWAAGPLRKGSNLCHGTAGNGYAFLKLYARTGDIRWLERARAFAMHAIAQMQAEERAVGRLRHSLWTGDPGVAVYLADCIGVTPRFPTLDVFWGAPA